MRWPSFVAMVSQLFNTETDFAAIADEIVGRIGDELDYAREAKDCEAFARLYKNQDVCVPRVFQEFCGPRVLTLSYLPGTKLDEWGRSGPSPAQKKRIIEEPVWKSSHVCATWRANCAAPRGSSSRSGFFTPTPTPAICWWTVKTAGLPRLRQDGPAG